MPPNKVSPLLPSGFHPAVSTWFENTFDAPTPVQTAAWPHILVTTPESLYLLLTSVSGRNMLAGVSTLIVDEIHALAGNKRGSHLSLSLARLDALCGLPPARIGPPQWQRNQAEDLVAVVFPDQIACFENIRGAGEIPDHPLVNQGLLRQAVETDRRPQYTVISACDPLNLGGLITQGVKTPSITGNRILLENGLPVARTLAEELDEFPGISSQAGHEARKRLLVVRPWPNYAKTKQE